MHRAYSLQVTRGQGVEAKATIFLTRDSSYCCRNLLIAILSVRPSVRPSVHHTGGSVKNGAS